jgi:hypothetical protein
MAENRDVAGAATRALLFVNGLLAKAFAGREITGFALWPCRPRTCPINQSLDTVFAALLANPHATRGTP